MIQISAMGRAARLFAIAGALALTSMIFAPTAAAQGTTPATPTTPPTTEAAKPADAAPAAAAAASTAATAASAAAASAAQPAAKAAEAKTGDIGFIQSLIHGGIVSWVTAGIMLIMSLGSWYIIAVKLVEQNKINKQGAAARKAFQSAGTVRSFADGLAKDSAYRFIAEQGIEATQKHTGLMGNVDINTFVTASIDRSMSNVQSRLQDGLAFLATVGSTAPFVGLFGTVWGILKALIQIGRDGQASIDKIALPVGEALYMTAIGLAVAVPAVLGYNWLVRRNKSAMENVREFGSDLHAVLLSQSNLKK